MSVQSHTPTIHFLTLISTLTTAIYRKLQCQHKPAPNTHTQTHQFPRTPCLALFCTPRSNFTLNDNPNAVLVTAFGFGMAMTVMLYSVAHTSGGHINPAVTVGLLVLGDCHWITALFYISAQFVGACVGTLFVSLQTPGLEEYGANKLARLGDFSPPNCSSCEWTYVDHPQDGWFTH